jgi:hypothetical protein
MSDDRSIATRVYLVLVVWFSLAFGLSTAGLLESPPRPLVPIVLALATGTLLWCSRRGTALSRFVAALDVRVLIGFHIVRAPIGVWFLVADARGTLPGSLAQLAGWGDLAVGGAAVLAVVLPPEHAWTRRVCWAWNVAGLADILAVVITAQRLLLFAPDRLATTIGHPFVLLPLFVVPLVIASHLRLFARLRQPAAA